MRPNVIQPPSDHSQHPGRLQLVRDRRRFLAQSASGLAGITLEMVSHGSARANASEITTGDRLAAKPAHQRPTARSVIFLMMEGGPSQIDTFDPKPELANVDGKLFERQNVRTSQVKGKRYFVRSPFRFRKYGECGMDVSELFAETAAHVDDIAFLRSGYCESDNHPAAVFQYTTGYPVQGNPSIGSWIVYGLGSGNLNLPSYVVLRDGKPFGGTSSWGNGFLPALYQGVQFRSGDKPVLHLTPPAGSSPAQQRSSLDLLRLLNRQHMQSRPGFSDFEARIAAYDLAYRMQREIPEVINIADETQQTHKLYGLDRDTTQTFGKRCLLARRLVERGVRFVQVWSGGWDSHDDVYGGHRKAAQRVDRPIAGLLQDLKHRGLLEDTLVVWGGEFGRTADTTEAAFKKQAPGRDHNPKAMMMWFAGGGVRGGSVVGATDEFGERSVDERHHIRDVHATILHLLGLDQEELTYYHGGRLKRLTDNGGEIIQGLLA